VDVGQVEAAKALGLSAAGTFRFFETYSIIAYIYLLLTVGLSLALRALERRLRSEVADER